MGPFFNIKQAADYCGYKPITFYRKIKEYVLPFHGPNKNRLAKVTLDDWMTSPESFKPQRQTRHREIKKLSV